MGKNSQQQKPNQFIIVVVIGVVISALYVWSYMKPQNQEYNSRNTVTREINQKANQDSQFKTVGKDTPANTANNTTKQVVKQDTGSIDERVMQVARNFRCACGGCGELQLATCQCDMPRGAEEEKAFIRYNLKDGLTVDRVIQLVDKKYGHRNT